MTISAVVFVSRCLWLGNGDYLLWFQLTVLWSDALVALGGINNTNAQYLPRRTTQKVVGAVHRKSGLSHEQLLSDDLVHFCRFLVVTFTSSLR